MADLGELTKTPRIDFPVPIGFNELTRILFPYITRNLNRTLNLTDTQIPFKRDSESEENFVNLRGSICFVPEQKHYVYLKFKAEPTEEDSFKRISFPANQKSNLVYIDKVRMIISNYFREIYR